MALDFDGQSYNNPAEGDSSTVGGQIRIDHYLKKALIETRKEEYFGQLADVVTMPKHMGKKLRKYHYLPLLDDRNVNDQGIDANGVSTTREVTITITNPDGAVYYAVGEGATDAAALAAAQDDGENVFKRYSDLFSSDWATTKAAAEAVTPSPWVITGDSTAGAVSAHGNLYGSSKDPGAISAKMPLLSENGGRVNRVGFTRVEVQGTIKKYGFFDEYTKESLDFDSDADLRMHVNREMLSGAREMTEDLLQIDLLNAATTRRYTGAASSMGEVTADGANGNPDVVLTYADLARLSKDLDDNRTPRQTTMITGTRMVDTKVIKGGRVMYVGSEMEMHLEEMVDSHGNPAFVSIEKYAAGGNTLNGEIGSIGKFRIIVVPEMMNYAGQGATVTDNDGGYYETNGKYDVFPMLVVGEGAFSTVGFQTDGKTVKFKVKHAAPESVESYALDPYGETGFMSIKWYYGIMILRAERLGLVLAAAKM